MVIATVRIVVRQTISPYILDRTFFGIEYQVSFMIFIQVDYRPRHNL